MCKRNWLGPFNICTAEWHMAIGDFPATDAERLCFTPVCGADPAHRFPLQWGAAWVPAALAPTFRHRRFPVLRVLLAALCGLSVSKTLATSQSLGMLRNTASLNIWLRWTPSSAPLPLFVWVSVQFYSTTAWNKLLLKMFNFSLEPLIFNSFSLLTIQIDNWIIIVTNRLFLQLH